MAKLKSLIDELKNYKNICLYPSCGTDLSDIDYFCSGCLPREERKKENAISEVWSKDFPEPEVYVHCDVNFYMEFESGDDLDLNDCGIHGKFEILDFEQLESIVKPNKINNNMPFSGQIFKYKIKVWEKANPIILIFCICENEAIVADIFLKNKIPLTFIWSKNWNGGRTYGPWLAKAARALGVKIFYADWLCLPNLRGEPSNSIVYEHYPELKVELESKLERTDNHWIEEGSHGWVDEFIIK